MKVLAENFLEPLAKLRNKIAHGLNSADAEKIEEILKIKAQPDEKHNYPKTKSFFRYTNKYFGLEKDDFGVFDQLNLYIKASLKLPTD
ncbi:MAG: hypothetical protein AAFQ83_25860 [Bacteroidota bacterium]